MKGRITLKEIDGRTNHQKAIKILAELKEKRVGRKFKTIKTGNKTWKEIEIKKAVRRR